MAWVMLRVREMVALAHCLLAGLHFDLLRTQRPSPYDFAMFRKHI
jgi:hypothetical protein